MSPEELQLFSSLSNIALTFGLLVFAGMQVWVMHRSERRRQEERSQDHQREAEASYGIVRSIWIEVGNLSASFRGVDDFLDHARNGFLRPDTFYPADPIQVLSAAARFGAAASHLMHSALAELRHASTSAHQLGREVQLGVTPDILRQHAGEILSRLEEAERVLNDVVDHSLDVQELADMRVLEGSKSQTARRLGEVSGFRPRPALDSPARKR